MIKFTTINVDGVKVTREFNTAEEVKNEWMSDECDLPSNDDELIEAEIDGVPAIIPALSFEVFIENLDYLVKLVRDKSNAQDEDNEEDADI